jgi:hypothetical protein
MCRGFAAYTPLGVFQFFIVEHAVAAFLFYSRLAQ